MIMMVQPSTLSFLNVISLIKFEDVEMENADDFENRSHSPSVEPKQLERPSEYLRARCPLCFGGEDWSKPEEM